MKEMKWRGREKFRKLWMHSARCQSSLTLLLQVLDVPGSYLVWKSFILTGVFIIFAEFFRKVSKLNLKLSHGHFLA
jgi:hypothetical protein